MKCVLCNSQRKISLFQIADHEIVRCQNCGLVRTEGGKRVSYKSYHRDRDYQKLEKDFKNIFQKRFNLIKKFKVQPGRVLDIGASTGILLDIFQTQGWEAWGIEPSKSAKLAKKRGLKILQTTFEKAKLSQNYFDVVILNHTLEHLDDPLEVLKRIEKVLKRDGIVYVDVPNFDSISAQLWGKRWKYLTPDEHLYHFTPQTLQRLFKKAGFKIKHWETRSGVFDVANPFFKFYQNLINLRKSFLIDFVRIPLDIISVILNKGTSLAMIGQKL